MNVQNICRKIIFLMPEPSKRNKAKAAGDDRVNKRSTGFQLPELLASLEEKWFCQLSALILKWVCFTLLQEVAVLCFWIKLKTFLES